MIETLGLPLFTLDLFGLGALGLTLVALGLVALGLVALGLVALGLGARTLLRGLDRGSDDGLVLFFPTPLPILPSRLTHRPVNGLQILVESHGFLR